jgi:hypothetical protein
MAWWVGPKTAFADEPAAKDAAIYDAAARAVAKGWTDKTRMVGFSIVKTAFTEVPREGAVLVGFDLGIGNFMDIENIYAIRAVYRTADGEVSNFGEHGLFKDKRGPGKKVYKSKVTHTVRVRARPGYAVGAVTLRTGLNINGLSVTFMRIDGTALDPGRSYMSEWVGDRTGGSESTVTGDGAPIVGVFGNEDAEHVMALGLIYLQRPGQSAPAAEPPRPQPAPKGAAKAPRPAAELPPAAVNPPPANRPDAPPEPIKERFVDKYVDHEHHFSLTVPDGWQRMFPSEMKAIKAVLRQRQLDNLVHYEMGFRPNSSRSGSYPYILVQVHEFDTTGLTYSQIQEKLDMGLDEPIKFAEGKFSDVLQNLSAGRPVLDRSRNRIVVRLESDVFGVGKVLGLSTCHLGAEGVVSVHCYAKEESFDRLMPTFTDLNNSFFFDDGHDFVATKETKAESNWTPVFVFVGVSLGLGLAFLAFVGRNWLARPTIGGLSPAARAPAATLAPSPSTAIREGRSPSAPNAPIVLGPNDLVK